jgi:hypothetical protein
MRWYLTSGTLSSDHFGLSEEIRMCILPAGSRDLGTGREGLVDQCYG